ncbi:MAG: hypothetical protein AAF624_16360, partial [Bacteroidota bacterium]
VYGTALSFGPNVSLVFDQARLEAALRRLGYSADNIRHLASAAQSETPTEQVARTDTPKPTGAVTPE